MRWALEDSLVCQHLTVVRILEESLSCVGLREQRGKAGLDVAIRFDAVNANGVDKDVTPHPPQLIRTSAVNGLDLPGGSFQATWPRMHARWSRCVRPADEGHRVSHNETQ